MVQRALPWIGAVLAAAVLAGCGSSGSGRAPEENGRARTAIEHGLLSSVRTAPGVGSVSSVHCVARRADGHHWSCRLAGDRPQDVAVTVNDDGWWSADGVKAAAAPQMGPAGSYTGDFTSRASLMGCCVPRS